MSPFIPSGDRARWRVVYDLLMPLKSGDVITYNAMGLILGLDPDDDRHTIQMALRRAAKEFEEVDKHAVQPIPNVGYRIVETPEHLELAQAHQRKAGRQLVRGHSKVVNADLSQVDPEIRNAFQVVAAAFSMQMDMNRRLDARQKNLEQTMTSIAERQERSADEVAELRERLARIEEQARQGKAS